MGKRFSTILKSMLIASMALSATAQSADIFVDCTGENPASEQCKALYEENSFLPKAEQSSIVQPNDIDINTPYNPINATPALDKNEVSNQIVMRDTAAPLAISQPLNEMEEVGSEYSVYKIPSGSLIVERDVTENKDDNGTVIQTQRTKETTVTPSYVDMPSISASKLKSQVAYGDAVHDWEALSGDNLRNLLIEWGQKSGWTVVWKLDRDYILEAGVVFRGTFTEVASAIIRTFTRAIPAPFATFYNGNRVLVINTQEDDNA